MRTLVVSSEGVLILPYSIIIKMHQVFKCVCSCIFMICGLLISNSVIIKLMLKPKPVFQTVVYLVRECVKVKTGLIQRKINDFRKFYDFLLLKNSRALNKNVVYRFSNFKIVGISFNQTEGLHKSSVSIPYNKPVIVIF